MRDAPIRIGLSPSHPGSFILTEVIEPLGLTIGRAAEILDVRQATLHDLVNGNAALTPEMALRLEMAFGIDLAMLLRMQAWYDAEDIRRRSPPLNIRRYRPA